jgi:parallel beta-helix repeat protein
MSPSSLLAGLGAAALLLAGAPGRAAARTLIVHEGDSIRGALARASPGDRIEVMPGTYREGAPGDLNALTVTLDGIELVGRSRPGRPVVLENAGGQSFGIWVSPPDSAGPGPEADPEHPPCGLDGSTLRGFALHGFTIRGFEVHGVHLACADGFALTANVSDGNVVYGLFPVVSRDGIIAANEAMNTPKDAAIYVGQSDRVLIAGNRVHDSLLGIEVENSRRCAVVGNEVYGNSFGIFVDLLPFLERSTQESTKVAKNDVHDNARANTADPSDILGVLPAGIGVLVVAGDTTVVSENRVERNPFTGIAVTSLCTGLALQGLTCDGLDIDPFPDRNRIVRNVVLDNGTVPAPDPALDALRGDLVWDGTGNGNCWSRNRFGTSSPPELPACDD